MRKLAARLTATLLPVALAAPALSAAQPAVSLTEDANFATLANGSVAARIEKKSGDIISLKYGGLELIGRGRGYWSSSAGSENEEKMGRLGSRVSFRIRTDPAANGGARAEIACRRECDGAKGTLPLDVELRYTLGRGDSGLYCSALWKHRTGQAAVSIVEARMAIKLNADVFDFLTVDANRRRQMATGYDWDHGTPLNVAEARRLTTGIRKGEAEHKYDYSAILAETPAYGWSSTRHRVGLWMINPSIEYITGGPTKVELTGHLDGQRGGLPTLLNMWQGSHYGGGPIHLAGNEPWSKFVGPFLLYCNAGADPDAMWRDALAQAQRERRAWPYDWVSDPAFSPASERGAVSGRVVVNDPQMTTATASNAWVGVTAPGDWQRDGNHYQFWSRADATGNFALRNVRAGNYTLYAFADGVLGEFSRADVTVAAGRTNDLGSLTWTPVRHGRQLWQIGVADRSAAEFRHGDHYWQWGLYLLYPKEFPDDVHFVIGQSDWRRDWNYCQPPRLGADGKTHDTTWKIEFAMPAAARGTATLRLAICGSRKGGRVRVSVNDRPVGDTGELPNQGVMHRDGIRGYWLERDVAFDAALLKPGTNTLRLRSRGDNWTQGVLYDCVRLELEETGRR